MSRVQPRQQNGTQDQDHGKAALLFTTILTIAGGFAGLAVAGMVLGFDYMLHGEPHERERLAQQRADRARDRYADALAWLENDRAERQRFRQLRRDWFAADPATRGDAPSSGETFGRVMARAWHSLLVGGARFKKGWNKGREEARQRRDDKQQQWWRRTDKPERPAPQDPATEQAPPSQPVPQPTAQPQPDNKPDIVDAEIVPDAEPSTREVVPVGQDEPRRPDETVDEYQRRIDELKGEVQQNSNNRQPDLAQAAAPATPRQSFPATEHPLWPPVPFTPRPHTWYCPDCKIPMSAQEYPRYNADDLYCPPCKQHRNAETKAPTSP